VLKEEIKTLLNELGKKRTPTLFIIDFELKNYYIKPLDELDSDIFYSIDKNPLKKKNGPKKDIEYEFQAVEFKRYKEAFDKVIEEIKRGNTYLLNLTFKSLLKIEANLKTIYEISDAKFKLYFKDKFVCFSPERFINIKDNMIFTYPMKGTIDAKIPDAKKKILSNKKEMAEHIMVVDLLRNDLNMVSKSVKVEKFRYVESIKAGSRELLQVSSKISGELENSWQDRLGEIITTLLPAGSITGTPKIKTVKIIKEVEGYERGFFTGVFGVFDGESLDSAVMIRFVEKEGDKLYYKSGGGITIDSNVEDEYNELKEKVYVPIF
jgi:para-aminobenzoate synthetase component 1